MGRPDAGGYPDIGIDPGFYDQRTEAVIFDRLYHLYPVYRDRYGGGFHADEYGYDDAAADNDIHAV